MGWWLIHGPQLLFCAIIDGFTLFVLPELWRVGPGLVWLCWALVLAIGNLYSVGLLRKLCAMTRNYHQRETD